MVNDNKSCFSSLTLHSSRVSRSPSVTNQISSDDQIYLQAYQQPLKAFHHFLTRLKECHEIVFEFTQFSLRTFAEPITGLTASWQSLLSVVEIENPLLPPTDSFPVAISGFAVDWFHFLVEGISSTGMLSKSTLIIKASSSFGIKMIIPGLNQAEIDVGSFNFSSCRFDDDTCTVVVSLKEFMALMNLASSLHSLVNISFGSDGLY